ncbi:MAG: transcription antitermination factor NusB [Treponema sp.]|nr:transcription antitermination factor NusB [Treponema sp.]
MSRRKGRILAFQALYSWDVGGVAMEDLLTLSWMDDNSNNAKGKEKLDESDVAYARLLISGTITHIGEVDDVIKSHLSTSWTMERLNKVTLAILRMSVYSILYQEDLHPTIIIDEAIDIAKKYGQDDSFRFINAILDAIGREKRKSNDAPAESNADK